MPSPALFQETAVFFIRSHELCALSVGIGSASQPRSSISTFPRMCYRWHFCQILYIAVWFTLPGSRKKKKQKQNLSMLKFWVPSFQLECTSSARTAAEKRRNQFAHSHEPRLWKTDSAGERRWAVLSILAPKLSCQLHMPNLRPATLHIQACFSF